MPLRLARLLRPFEDFFKHQAAGGFVLLGATLLALTLANSPFRGPFHHLWEVRVTLGGARFGLTQTLHHWVNDGLMAVFFFVVGLEIKREFLAGELATLRNAALPVAAAIGGMLVPALLFRWVVPHPPESHGWGIPMATDIAFALGVVALLGKKIPRSLAIFLTALAIVDDLGAVAVIALFYTATLSPAALVTAGGFLLVLLIGNRIGLQHPTFYALVGFALWVALLKSGIHASVAGVLIGATIPVQPRHSQEEFLQRSARLFDRYRSVESVDGPFLHEERLGALLALEHVCQDAMSPLQRMEHVMGGWVTFGVLPLFALANAGIPLSWASLKASLAHPLPLGVALGLLVGKPLGIVTFSWLAVRLRVADLPRGTGWRDILGVGVLGGIGFTMSLFVANLAFTDPGRIAEAKVGIFAASLVAGLVGFALFAGSGKKQAAE